MKNVSMAGPSIMPQKPKLEIPAKMAKKIKSSLIFVGFFTNFSFIHFIIKGFTKLSAKNEITTIE